MPRPRSPRPGSPPPVSGRDDSPENLERLRAYLEVGFQRLHDQFEAKSRTSDADASMAARDG